VPGGFPAMTVRAVGTGGGSRDTAERPNITRAVNGAASGAEPDLHEGDVTVVESTVDDLDPRLWPSVLQAVRAAGAWDCWCTPIVGRHRRPGAGPDRPVRRTGPSRRGRRDFRPYRDARHPLVPDEPADRLPDVGAGGSGTARQQPGRYGQGGRHHRWSRGLRNGHGGPGRGGNRRPGPGLAGAGRLRGRRGAVPRPGSRPAVTPPLAAPSPRRLTRPPPLSTYSAPGGWRQDPGRVAE